MQPGWHALLYGLSIPIFEIWLLTGVSGVKLFEREHGCDYCPSDRLHHNQPCGTGVSACSTSAPWLYYSESDGSLFAQPVQGQSISPANPGLLKYMLQVNLNGPRLNAKIL